MKRGTANMGCMPTSLASLCTHAPTLLLPRSTFPPVCARTLVHFCKLLLLTYCCMAALTGFYYIKQLQLLPSGRLPRILPRQCSVLSSCGEAASPANLIFTIEEWLFTTSFCSLPCFLSLAHLSLGQH